MLDARPIPMANGPVIVVHGGADRWSTDTDNIREACRDATEAGLRVITSGGAAVQAVITAVRVLEDAPACDAGTGAVLTRTGTLELDACLMDGSTLTSGAVAALPPFRHPIDIAYAVLRDGRYHLLVGEGAASFAKARGFTPSDPDSMITEERRAELARGARPLAGGNTVGAVARDTRGRLAAATSTGGIAGKDAGRVGDTPIVGAGTYADHHGACSCTGTGEAYARACAAFWSCEHVETGPQATAEAAVARVRDQFGGLGGVILVDQVGRIGVAHTSPVMPHGIGRPDFPVFVAY